MAETSEDARIVSNESLRARIRSGRAQQLESMLRAREELRTTAILSRCTLGRVNSPHAIALDLDRPASAHFAALFSRFAACLPEYAIKDAELWIGDEQATPPHNDAYLYLGVGRAVALQFWLLLDACTASPPHVEVARDKNALECLLPIAEGVLWPGMSDVITTSGRVPFHHDRVVGGDDLSLGDLLVFTNGVVHRAPGRAGVLRAALAFRAVLRSDERSDDIDYMLWFRDACRTDAELHVFLEQQSNPYYRRAKVRWRLLPDRPPDAAALGKIDRNDRQALYHRLEQYDFSGGAESTARVR